VVRPLVAIGVNCYETQKKISKEVTFHLTSPAGPKTADHRGSALPLTIFPSKIKIQQTSIDNSSSATPLATSRRGAATQPYWVRYQSQGQS
jgi:hypothetical protein